ncbi:adenosine deaminase/editase [Sordaria brevicollis]|uniref:Adenosine deaminase/editase n=1 Tax=Sordaria brevicollis TaxID=83679 RepID=A0AAE0PDI9_SORBR|nr:adenosine deaminase/editase [Sordaria brevicollis]
MKNKMANADAIASAVLEEFSKLPAKRKPSVRDNGLHEWVPMAGIVAKGPNGVKCVALATGMKCLPASKLPQANGVAVHDWHAEILAIRAFNRFVLEECKRLAHGSQSEFIYRRTAEQQETPEVWQGQPFAWREDVSLHMYCSEAPCGDASMELIMAAQDDASPWEIPSPTPGETPAPAPTDDTTSLPGRAYFSQLGIVRRKPSRGDAPPSLSKSCSDKLALKQVTSLLSSLTSTLVSSANAYLTSVVLPESQYSSEACKRCFSASAAEGGRMAPLVDDPSVRAKLAASGYAFREFRVETTKMEFAFSRRAILPSGSRSMEEPSKKLIASNLATSWTLNGPRDGEGLVGGVLQGRRQFDPRGASLVSRRKMWALARDICLVIELDGNSEIKRVLGSTDLVYDEIKDVSGLLEGRRRTKEVTKRVALKGWLRNAGDGNFKLG